MGARAASLWLTNLGTLALGMLLTVATVMTVGRYGEGVGLGLPVGACVFVIIAAAFVLTPHVVIALLIPYYAALGTLKFFVSPLVSPTKDVITLAALGAAGVVSVHRRAKRVDQPLDRGMLVLVTFVLGLYMVNIGGNLSGETGYGIAWFHGVRLFAEPVLLAFVGLTLPNPERNLRWAAISLAATSCFVAVVGLLQQRIGVHGLLDQGYVFGSQVRISGSHLRSFGTLEDPFSYAGLLLLGLAGILLWQRRPIVYPVTALISAGVLVSYVRTAAVIAVALLGLAIAFRGHARFAAVVVLCALVAGVAAFVHSSQATATRSVRVTPSTYLTLNGRTNIWKSIIGDSESNWMFGRGVGAVGTASQRAQETLTGAKQVNSSNGTGSTVVDSAYFSMVADIGLFGLVLYLAFIGRIFYLARRAIADRHRSAWLAVGVLTVLLLDGLTRESIAGFPTAYISMLITGMAIATWSAPARSDHPRRERADNAVA